SRDCGGLSPAGTESADCRLAQVWDGSADFQCVRSVFFRGGGRLGGWQDRRDPALGTCHAPWGDRLARHRAPTARLRGDGGEQLLRGLVWRISWTGGLGPPSECPWPGDSPPHWIRRRGQRRKRKQRV